MGAHAVDGSQFIILPAGVLRSMLDQAMRRRDQLTPLERWLSVIFTVRPRAGGELLAPRGLVQELLREAHGRPFTQMEAFVDLLSMGQREGLIDQ